MPRRNPRHVLQIGHGAAVVAAERLGLTVPADVGAALHDALDVLRVAHRLPSDGAVMAWLIFAGAEQARQLILPPVPAPPHLSGLAALAHRSSQ